MEDEEKTCDICMHFQQVTECTGICQKSHKVVDEWETCESFEEE